MDPVVVVLGADTSLIEPEISDKDCLILHNSDWREGIASSIRIGIKTIENSYPNCDGALIMVCDQPYITSDVLLELMEVQKISGRPMAACNYEHVTGTPALFHQSVFSELLLLKGDKGAGKILNAQSFNVSTIPFEPAKFDIDTKKDYEDFLKTIG